MNLLNGETNGLKCVGLEPRDPALRPLETLVSDKLQARTHDLEILAPVLKSWKTLN